MNVDITVMREMELKLLIIEYNKASQLDRSFSQTKLSRTKKVLFREKLLACCFFLMNKVDDETLTNNDIREKIRELTKVDSGISFGQAQKVVNVVVKQYCFILNKESLFKELDCPLDSTTMKGYGINHKTMKDVNEDDYLEYQKRYSDEFDGMRILKDYNYDKMRIYNFLNPK